MWLQHRPDRCPSCFVVTDAANHFQAGIGHREPTASKLDVTLVLRQPCELCLQTFIVSKRTGHQRRILEHRQNPLPPRKHALQIPVACFALERWWHQKRPFRLRSVELRFCRLFALGDRQLILCPRVLWFSSLSLLESRPSRA